MSSSFTSDNLSRRSVLATAGGLLAMGTLAACSSGTSSSRPNATASTSPTTDNEPIASHILDPTPENQAATYRHIDRQKLGTRVIANNPARTTGLARSSKSLDGLSYTYKGTERTLDRFIAYNRVAGLLVLKDDNIVHEQYGMGNTETSRWTSMSISKSVTATLIGAALADGAIKSLDDPIPRYVPELKDSAYKDNTIRQVLQMTSGVKWNEAGADDPYGDNDIARMFKGVYGNDPGAVMELMRTRPRAAAPGSVFNYSTGEAYVASAVLIGATGKSASDYLSEKIWQPLGMEAEAYWMLDSPGGKELGGSCIQATLRDYGRFGQFILTGGEGVLPKGWRDEAGAPQSPVTDYGHPYPGWPGGYGYFWWAIPTGTKGARGPSPTFEGLGHGGQKLYVNPSEGVVIQLWSAWDSREPELHKSRGEQWDAILDATVTALR